MRLLQASEIIHAEVLFAASGIWEDAVKADCFTHHWVETAGNDIAVEAVYRDATGALVGFIGFRKVIDDAKDRCAFWQTVAHSSKSDLLYSPSDQLSLWLGLLECSPFLDRAPTHVELGVFNLWRSSGTVSLSSEQSFLPDALEGPDWVTVGADAPICRECVWDVADGIWVADAISENRNGKYYLQ